MYPAFYNNIDGFHDYDMVRRKAKALAKLQRNEVFKYYDFSKILNEFVILVTKISQKKITNSFEVPLVLCFKTF